MIEIEVTEGLIRLSGWFDAAQEEKARKALAQVNESAVVDLADLDYISSAGLGVLFAVQKRLLDKKTGEGLKLVNLNKHIRKVFDLARFDAVFEIE